MHPTLQQIYQQAEQFSSIPQIGIVASANFDNLNTDPNVNTELVIAQLFAYLQLNKRLGIELSADMFAVKMLESLGVNVEIDGSNDLQLIFEA